MKPNPQLVAPTPSFYVYGFTDRFCQNGFPGCDGSIATLEEASRVLRDLPNRGFHYCNSKGRYGWICEKDTMKTVEPMVAPSYACEVCGNTTQNPRHDPSYRNPLRCADVFCNGPVRRI